MAQKKITELPAISSISALSGDEVFPVVDQHVDYQVSLTQAQNFFGIYRGNGQPEFDAPNGSLYLRIDGTAGGTLYIHAQGNWSIASTPPTPVVIVVTGTASMTPTVTVTATATVGGSFIVYDSVDNTFAFIAHDDASDSTPFIIGDF